MAEKFPVITLISEPYKIPSDNPNWVGGLLNLTAITWKGCSPPCTLWKAGNGYVGVKWKEYVIICVYLSPVLTLEDYEDRLAQLSIALGTVQSEHIVLAGDFNAKNVAWGSPGTDGKGRCLEQWTAQEGLFLLNEGKVNTCIAWRGESIVDLTWASPLACRNITRWKVDDTKTLSDHKYISINLIPDPRVSNFPTGTGNRKWSIAKLDEEELLISLNGATWQNPITNYDDPTAGVAWLRRTLEDACDAPMPKAKKGKPKKAAYWWNKEIAKLRRKAIFAKRGFSKTRSRKKNQDTINERYQAYKNARITLKKAIDMSKAKN
ncbi:uncharacterized protein [Cardiocondyla obscurior]|uniref:uncharacterized protein n=1 Tax=Cardiocondyla obscurior TaxID=286306 RepID=UPI00396584DF